MSHGRADLLIGADRTGFSVYSPRLASEERSLNQVHSPAAPPLLHAQARLSRKVSCACTAQLLLTGKRASQLLVHANEEAG